MSCNTHPMNASIVADDKDWTWVIERACPECGFDAGAFDDHIHHLWDVEHLGDVEPQR